MTDPFDQIDQLIREKKATRVSMGISVTKHARYITIWGNPSSETLARGQGETLREAALDALSTLQDRPVTVTMMPGMMPGMVTR